LDRNVLLAFALSIAVFSGWLAWQENAHGPERRAAIERAKQEEAARLEVEEQARAVAEQTPPSVPPGEHGAVARTPGAAETIGEAAAQPAASDTTDVAIWKGAIENSVISGELTNQGAALTRWQLKDFYETPSREVKIELLDQPLPYTLNLTTPFEELGLGDLSSAVYEVEHSDDRSITFVLSRGGVVIRKTYSSQSDTEYGFRIDIEIENGTNRVLTPRFEVVWPALVNDRPDFQELSLIGLADDEVTRELVPGIGSPGFFANMFGNGDTGPITLSTDLEWAGIDLRYFAGLLIPDQDASGQVVFEPLEKGKSAAAVISLQPVEVAPGQSVVRGYTGFFGPKDPVLLSGLGMNLDRAINHGYSWVAPLASFFGSALHIVYGFIPNYGLAIILITVLVRVATWPIMARQMKSAERMRELMPRIKELQEKYKDDRQKQSEETFKLYRETGVNPLGGCLPMVLQLPVFIGLFFALQSSIDLRHAPFFLWIDDLSAPATLFMLPGVDFPVRILPILMGASMFIQQKMMPQTGMDPAQAKMMLIMMPGMMLVISYTFPSGLVLYWMVSNVLGIAHQLWVRSRMQADTS